MRPQSHMVAPVADLPMGHHRQRQQYGNPGRGQPSRGDMSLLKPIRYPPADHDEQAYEGQIRIAISHRLRTHLLETKHGHESPQEPKPSHRKIATTPALQRQPSDGEQQEKRTGYLPLSQRAAWMRIHGSEAGRPESLAYIPGIGNNRVIDAH